MGHNVDIATSQSVVDAARTFEGRIVVLLPTRNEGPEIVRTIRDLRKNRAPGTDLQFAVIDDGSTDECCKTLPNAKDITFMRNYATQGQGRARNWGVLMHPEARGYVSFDAHMRMETPFGLEQLVLDAEECGGVVGCLSYNLAKDTYVGIGSRWHSKSHGGLMNFNSTWNRIKPADLDKSPRLISIDLLSGQSYAFTKQTYDRLGGFHETYGLYGFFERDLCINARFQCVPMMADTKVAAWHLYRKARPYDMSGRWRWWGYVECLRQMFRPDIWESVFLPPALNRERVAHDPVLSWLIRTPHLGALQAAFEAKKKRTDEEVLEWMGAYR